MDRAAAGWRKRIHAGWAASSGQATAALVSALLLAIALRLAWLGSRHTWYDEVGSILFAEKDLATIVKATAADTMPPLYYFVLHYWLTLGNSLWVARSLSVLLSLIAVLLAYAIGRQLFGFSAGVGAALLMAISPFQVYHGQEVRMYALLLVAQLAGAYFLLRCLRGGGARDWVGFALTQAAALYTHSAAFVWIVALDAYAAAALLAATGRSPWQHLSLLAAPWRRFALGLATANVAVLLLFTPWLAFVPAQLEKVRRAFWIPRPGLADLLRTDMIFTFGLPAPTPAALPLVLALSLVILALVAQQVTRAVLLEGRSAAPLLYALALTLLPPTIALAVSQVRPIYVERVLLAASAMFCLLVAWSFLRLRPRALACAVGMPSILLLAWSLQAYYAYDRFPRPDFYQLAAFLRAEYRPEDVILHDNKLTFLPSYFLDRSLPQSFLADPAWSINDTLAEQTQEALGIAATTLTEATAGKQRVLFVIFRQALDEAAEQGRRQENKGWLDDHLRLTGEKALGDLLVLDYATDGRVGR